MLEASPPVRRVAAAAAVLFVLVGQIFEASAAVTWDLSLGGGAVRDDNLHLDPDTVEEGERAPVKETITAGAADFSLDWSGQHDFLRGTYRGEYWDFTGDEDLDPLWLHTLAADLGWRRWAPFFLEAREERNRIPRSQDQEGVAVVDMIDRNRVSGRAGFFRELGSRGAAELAYRGEIEAFSGVEDADKVQRQFGEGLVRYRWSPLWESELRVAYGRVDRRLSVDYAEASVAAVVDQRLSERLSMRYSLEWLRDDEDVPPPPEEGEPEETGSTVRNSLLKGAELRWESPAVGSWWLRYQDGLAAQPDGDTLRTGRAETGFSRRARLGSTLEAGGWYEERHYRVSGREDTAWGPTVRLRWLVAPWVACDLGGSWTSTKFRETGLPEVEDRRAEVSAGVIVVFAEHLTMEVGYRFQQNNSSDAARFYTGNQVSTWLTYHIRPLAPGSVPPAAGTAAPGR